MAQGDFHLHNYQDDLDAAEDKSTVDEFTLEQSGELSEESGIPEETLKEELDKIALDDQENTQSMEAEDDRENLEDRDEDLTAK